MVMPMMGMPIFSGSVPLAMGSLVGHLVYGATVVAIYGYVPELVAQGSPGRHPGDRLSPDWWEQRLTPTSCRGCHSSRRYVTVIYHTTSYVDSCQ